MTTHKEALTHLKAITEAFGPGEGIELDQKAWSKLHSAIKEALAQPEQEPVAWIDASSFAMMHQDPRFDRVQWQTTLTLSKVYEGQMPLYTTPPQRKPLTEEEINARAKTEGANNADFWAGVRFSEAEHCIKE